MVTQITKTTVGLKRSLSTFNLFKLIVILNTGSYADASTSDPTDNRPEPLAEDKLKVDNSVIINRTRLQPCDKVITLYTLDPPKGGDTSIYDEPANECER